MPKLVQFHLSALLKSFSSSQYPKCLAFETLLRKSLFVKNYLICWFILFCKVGASQRSHFLLWAGWYSYSEKRGSKVREINFLSLRMAVIIGRQCCKCLRHACSNCFSEPVWSWVTSLYSVALMIFNFTIAMKSLMVQWGHLACWKALAILHCCFLEDGKYSAVAFMDAFKAVCADSVGCLLPRLLIYCCCISSLQTTYFLLHCQDAGFCLDQGFLKIFDHFFSLVFTRLASSWASLFSSSISHFFFFKSAASFLLWMWSAWKASPTHSWCWTR